MFCRGINDNGCGTYMYAKYRSVDKKETAASIELSMQAVPAGPGTAFKLTLVYSSNNIFVPPIRENAQLECHTDTV